MDVSKALAIVGASALAVAGLAFDGTLLTVGPARPLALELIVVASVAFFLGLVVLLGAGMAVGWRPVGRWLRGRSPDG